MERAGENSARVCVPGENMALHQVPTLNPDQVQQFARDGMLVLPGVLDPQLCARARDDMWSVLNAHVPRLQRHDPSTWGPFTGDSTAGGEQVMRKPETNSHEGGDVLFECTNHRFTVRNGTSELMLDLCPRALFPIAEQLLGAGTVVYPAGLNADGNAVGPAFFDAGLQGGMSTHMDLRPDCDPSNRTEPLTINSTGPGFLNGQGTRGLYCTMPNSPNARTKIGGKGNGPFGGCHTDGGERGRVRLRVAAFIDDCPPGCGGYTIWKGSHVPIWNGLWDATRRTPEEVSASKSNKRVSQQSNSQFDGYKDAVMARVKQAAEPVEVTGPAGTVVLWHGVLAHVVGTNSHSDVIRQATIYEFHKTPGALPDAELLRRQEHDAPVPGLWDDWSQAMRHTAACGNHAATMPSSSSASAKL